MIQYINDIENIELQIVSLILLWLWYVYQI